jgi:hypothetical protein
VLLVYFLQARSSIPYKEGFVNIFFEKNMKKFREAKKKKKLPFRSWGTWNGKTVRGGLLSGASSGCPDCVDATAKRELAALLLME